MRKSDIGRSGYLLDGSNFFRAVHIVILRPLFFVICMTLRVCMTELTWFSPPLSLGLIAASSWWTIMSDKSVSTLLSTP